MHETGMQHAEHAAHGTLNELKRLVSGFSLELFEVPQAQTLGIGVGVALSESSFVVISVLGGDPEMPLLTSGVLRDINQDRLAALEACDDRVGQNPLMPFYLHDDSRGWDILLQQRFPLMLLMREPGFLQMCLVSQADVTEEARILFAERGLGGRAYELNDAPLLLSNSMF